MVAKHIELPTEIGLLRICAQALIPGTSRRGLGEVVSGLLAMQGQQVSAVPHALIARCPKTTGSEVAALFNSRTVVRHRPMRGTVHITAAKDFHWMRVALKSEYSAWDMRHHDMLGIDSRVIDEACAVAWESIDSRGGQLSRAQLFDAWAERLNTQHVADKRQLRQWCTWLMYAAMHEGAIVEGPAGKNQHLFIDARTLPSSTSSQSGFVLSPQNREAGITEIARRYILGHGPVTVADLAWWAGLSKTRAAAAMNAAFESDPNIGVFDIAGVKPASPTSGRQDRVFMRNDLPDVLAEHRAEAAGLLFLPSFDELYVGYANRTPLTDSAGDRLICPARNGMFRPLIIHGGRLVAVRPADGRIRWLSPSTKKLEKLTERLVEETLERLRS